MGFRRCQLTSDARLKEDLGADSLEEVEIVMALEERFNLTIPDDTSERISTVGDILEALAELLGTAEQKHGEPGDGMAASDCVRAGCQAG